MKMYRLSEQDKKQLESRGVSEIDFIDQLDLIKSGVPFINLQKPCTLGDGIKSLSGNDLEKYNRLFEDSLDKFRPVKFVPSSGAASRMFGLLNKIKLDYPDFKIRVAQNTTDKDDKDFLEFI